MKNKLFNTLILTLYATLFSINSHAQRPEKLDYFNKSFIGFLPSTNNSGNSFSKQRGTLISTVNGIKINSNLAVGIGVGIGAYVNPTFTSIPVFLDGNYYLYKKNNSPYAYADLGYSFSTANFIKGGILLEAGLGWKFKITDKFMLGPQVGYRNQSINKNTDHLGSISIGVTSTF